MTAEEQYPVKVDVGFSVKAEIKTEIPAESTGRLLDALTDALRPFTERQGLKADLIRLQREEVAIEIAKRAAERFHLEQRTPRQVSTKFLVPFFEKASLEEINSEIVDWWVRLLESAATAEEDENVSFVEILGRLGSKEVRLLESVWHALEDKNFVRPLDEAFRLFHHIFSDNPGAAEPIIMTPSTHPGMAEFEEAASMWGIVFVSWELQDGISGLTTTRWRLDPVATLALDVVIGANLFQRGSMSREIERTWDGRTKSISVRYAQLTSLGAAFLRACHR